MPVLTMDERAFDERRADIDRRQRVASVASRGRSV